jgi:hypothetical protein
MSVLARTADAVDGKPWAIHRPFSNFDFVDQWFPGCSPLRRILSQVRQLGGRTMVLERLGEVLDASEQDRALHEFCPAFARGCSDTFRLSFFDQDLGQGSLARATDNEFIGYAVIRRINVPCRGPMARVHESVLRPSRHPNNFVRGGNAWECRALSGRFRVNGYLYAQQDGITTHCSHAVLRCVGSRFHAAGDLSYSEIWDILRKRSPRTSPHDALDTEEIAHVLEAVGARCVRADFTRPTYRSRFAPFQRYLYGSIESGYPAIVVFRGKGRQHAMAVFGHTFNEDTWVPDAVRSYFTITERIQYIPSESWVSMYLGHDDNWGSNFCIPSHYLRPRYPCNWAPSGEGLCDRQQESVVGVIGTLPGYVVVDPLEAEAIAVSQCFPVLRRKEGFGNRPWERRLLEHLNKGQIVLRTLLVHRDEYLRHIERVRDWGGDRALAIIKDALQTSLPPQMMWMIEISVPELFSANRRKLGELLVLAEKVREGGARRSFPRETGGGSFLGGSRATSCDSRSRLPTG